MAGHDDWAAAFTATPVLTTVAEAELARLRRVEAAARRLAWRQDSPYDPPWWYYVASSWGDGVPTCIGCGEDADSWRDIAHDPDCAAMALDAALADDPGGTA